MPIEYTDPIELTELPQLIRAVNTKTGYLPSTVVDATYTQIQVATPTFNPSSSTVPYPFNVTINCATSGVVILYSVDGSEPSLTYSGPVAITSDTPLKAKATKTNYLTSDVGSAVYSQAQVPIVTFSPNSSAVVFPQTVYLATTLGDADIYYTIGSNPPDPTTADILYDPNTGIVVNSAVTIKAFGVKVGYLDGDVSSATYTQVQVATPTFSQSYNSGNSYWYPNTVTLSCATSSVTMYYTVDGSTPTTSSTLYSAPFDITASVTVKALAVKSGYLNSTIGSRIYDQQRVTATPTITQNNSESGITNATGAAYPTVVTISGESGATFRYTVDGSTPDGSSTLYSAPFNNLNVATLKVKSFKTNYVDSAVVTQSYTQRTVSPPVFSHPGGEIVLGSTVSISTTTPGCSIYYTVDGSTPTNASTLYTAPVTINAALTLKAIAYKTSGFQPASWQISSVTSASYIGPLSPAVTITPDGSGAYEFPVKVQLLILPEGLAVDAIYYTVDGSTPDNTDTLYTGYFTITDTTTVKAISVKAGYSDSNVAAATITKATSQRRGWASPASGSAIADNTSISIVGAHDVGAGITGATLLHGIPYGAGGQILQVIQLRSGKFLACGSFASINSATRSKIARLMPEYGVTDLTFVESACNGTINAAVELPDGTIIVGGSFSIYQGVTRNNLAKITSNGTLVTAFTAGTNGGVTKLLCEDANSNLFIGGSFNQVTPTGGVATSSHYWARLNFDGTLGLAAPQVSVASVNTMALANERKLVVGTSTNLRRYLTGSSDLDTGFTSIFLSGTIIYAIKPLATGKILVAGKLYLPGSTGGNDYWALVRINVDGTLDNTFTKYGNGGNYGLALTVDLDGKIYLGSQTSANTISGYVLKFDADGTNVTGYNTNLTTTGGGINTCIANCIVLDYGDRLLTGSGSISIFYTAIDGVNKQQVGMVKLLADGSVYRGLYGNNIKFTLNGTTPTAASSDWPGSLSINQESEVFPTIKTKIRSIPLNGFEFGTMDTYDYTWAQVATPVATPGAGAVGFGSTVTLSCATSGASIYYTTDGSTPDNTDTLYTTPITINAALTLKAIAYKTNYKTSAVVSADYTQATVATPTASPTSGAVVSGSTVTLSCATSGASIYYSLDGLDPNLMQLVPIMTSDTAPSGVASASSYNGTAAWHAFDRNASTLWNSGFSGPWWLQYQFPSAKTVVSYALTPSGTAPQDFTLEGSSNGTSWTTLDTRSESSWTSNERRVFTVSSPASYSYYRVHATTVAGGSAMIIVSFELLGANTTTYSSPLALYPAVTVKAIAKKSGYINSAVMSEDYTQVQVATPVANPTASAIPFGSTVALSCATSGASIWYTVDGTTPVESNSLLIPQMTSASTPSGVASASSTGSYSGILLYGWKAMDRGASTFPSIWQADGSAMPQWLQYQFPSAQTVGQYAVTVWSDSLHMPRDFQLQYSSNGSSWTTADTRASITWTAGERKVFTLSSSANAVYWRLYVTANGSSNYTTVQEFELLGAGGSSSAYSGPITVNAALTIKAKGFKANWAASNLMSEAYTQAQLGNVIFNPVDGTSGVSLVTLTNAVSGTTIRYTTNGSTPTISNGFTYSGPIGIVTPKTVKAYALKTGYIDSNVAEATYP